MMLAFPRARLPPTGAAIGGTAAAELAVDEEAEEEEDEEEDEEGSTPAKTSSTLNPLPAPPFFDGVAAAIL